MALSSLFQRAADAAAIGRFDDYADQTGQCMRQMNRLIAAGCTVVGAED